MYVVLGATGNTGSVIATSLLLRGEKVRVVGRNACRLDRFVRKGAEAFTASVSDASALTRAFTGARVAYVMLPPSLTSADYRTAPPAATTFPSPRQRRNQVCLMR
jgi:uncharacterized protein YbjT (DUF2867 family)